jgi:hypothetical protein
MVELKEKLSSLPDDSQRMLFLAGEIAELRCIVSILSHENKGVRSLSDLFSRGKE